MCAVEISVHPRSKNAKHLRPGVEAPSDNLHVVEKLRSLVSQRFPRPAAIRLSHMHVMQDNSYAEPKSPTQAVFLASFAQLGAPTYEPFAPRACS